MAKRKTTAKHNDVLRKFLWFFFIMAISVMAIIFLNGYIMYKQAIANMPLTNKINEIKNNSNFVNIGQVSQNYLNATIAVEDHRFYSHSGFDFISTINALFSNIVSGDLVGRGGSTITQQLAKNMYFEQEKTFSRKIAELFVVYQLEKELSKDEIFELYINIIYFGDGYYGIKEASNGFYDKEPSSLTNEEAIMLAGLPAAPSIYSPTVNSTLANERYKQVETAMKKYGYFD